jgi:hypothetical protein
MSVRCGDGLSARQGIRGRTKSCDAHLDEELSVE